MLITPTLVLTTLLLLWVNWLWSRRRFYRLHAKLPGPIGLPFIGSGIELMKTERDFLIYLDTTSKKYKTPCTLWLGTDCLLYVNDPETIETVFQTPCCTDKGKLYRFLSEFSGDGLFFSKSPRWNNHRRLLNPAFGRNVIETFYPIFNEETNVLISKLARTQSQSLELFEVLKKCVLEIACQTTMGNKMNFQDDRSTEILNAYTGLAEVIIERVLTPLLHPDVIFRNTGAYKLGKHYGDVVDTFVRNQLTALKNSTTTAAAPKSKTVDDDNDDICIKKSKPKVFIQRVSSLIHNGKFTYNDVVEEANVMVTASFDTISTTIYFVCLCLAIHPEFQDKLYNELLDIFPRDDDDDDGKELNLSEVTKEDLEHMTYTEMVINEAMRLFAPVPVVIRTATDDFRLRDGTVVPRGTQVAIDIYNMQRSEKVWGPYARSFDPERHFGAANSEQHPYAFIPFTKGLRMCIGYRYAMAHMKIMVAKIFLNFRLRTDAKLADLKTKGTISLKLSHYPLCIFEARNNSQERGTACHE